MARAKPQPKRSAARPSAAKPAPRARKAARTPEADEAPARQSARPRKASARAREAAEAPPAPAPAPAKRPAPARKGAPRKKKRAWAGVPPVNIAPPRLPAARPAGYYKARALRKIQELVPIITQAPVEALVRRCPVDRTSAQRKKSLRELEATGFVGLAKSVLPTRFGDLVFDTVDAVVRSDPAFGIYFKNIDERAVVRGFSDSSAAADTLRCNDVLVAVGNVDARAVGFAKTVEKLRACAPAGAAALRVARPRLRADLVFEPRAFAAAPAAAPAAAAAPPLALLAEAGEEEDDEAFLDEPAPRAGAEPAPAPAPAPARGDDADAPAAVVAGGTAHRPIRPVPGPVPAALVATVDEEEEADLVCRPRRTG